MYIVSSADDRRRRAWTISAMAGPSTSSTAFACKQGHVSLHPIRERKMSVLKMDLGLDDTKIHVQSQSISQFHKAVVSLLLCMSDWLSLSTPEHFMRLLEFPFRSFIFVHRS